MLSFFRRKAPPPLPTFNERVTAFWAWFAREAPRLYATIEEGRCPSLADETSAKVDEYFPGFAWVYGKGRDGVGHSFTLTGEGNIHRQLLTLQWLAQAPRLEGWTFHAARQPDGISSGQVIEMHETRFDAKAIWVTPHVDEQSEKIDLTIWHPAWEKLEDRQKYSVAFIFLDEVLGEYGTDWWVGEINLGGDKLAQSFPLAELADFVTKTAREKGWKKYPPGDCWTLYKIKDVEDAFPRSDLFSLSTAVPRLFHDYMQAKGDLPDPLADTGADYVYVSVARDFFPQGGEVAKRGEIEDALEAALKAINGGRVVGGGLGRERGYSDLLIFDGKRSLDAIQQALRWQNVPAGTMIEFFAQEKRAQRIAL